MTPIIGDIVICETDCNGPILGTVIEAGSYITKAKSIYDDSLMSLPGVEIELFYWEEIYEPGHIVIAWNQEITCHNPTLEEAIRLVRAPVEYDHLIASFVGTNKRGNTNDKPNTQ